MSAHYRFAVSFVPKPQLMERAAYIAAKCLRDELTGLLADYRARNTDDRDEVLLSRLLLPGGRVHPDMQLFWNAVQRRNNHPNAVTARQIIGSLPGELSRAQARQVALAEGRRLSDFYGVAVQVALHGPRDLNTSPASTNGNWHVHYLLSYCNVSLSGELLRKEIRLDPFSCMAAKIENFCDVERPLWAASLNAVLEANGSATRVDHRSLLDQGSEDEPTIHLGPKLWALMKKGVHTGLIDLNLQTIERNEARRRQREQAVEAARLLDVAPALSDASAEGPTIEPYPPVPRGERFQWSRSVLSAEERALIDYVHRPSGVVALVDGGRLVDLGTRYLVIKEGLRADLYRVLRARCERHGAMQFVCVGPADWKASAEALLSPPTRPNRERSGYDLDTDISSVDQFFNQNCRNVQVSPAPEAND